MRQEPGTTGLCKPRLSEQLPANAWLHRLPLGPQIIQIHPFLLTETQVNVFLTTNKA